MPTVSEAARRHLIVALADNGTGKEVADLLDSILAGTVQHATGWFNVPVTNVTVLAPTPGTADANAMSRFGRVSIPEDGTLQVVHFHYDHPAGTGTYELELWRRRDGVNTLIANCSADGTEGDFGTYDFTFVSEALKAVEAWDYLLLQATAVMSGAGAKNAAGFVDIHALPTALFT